MMWWKQSDIADKLQVSLSLLACSKSSKIIIRIDTVWLTYFGIKCLFLSLFVEKVKPRNAYFLKKKKTQLPGNIYKNVLYLI